MSNQPVYVVTEKRSSSLGVTSAVLGGIALLLCWIPFVGLITIPISGIALLLAGIGFLVALCRAGRGIGWPIGGGVISAVALLVGLFQFGMIGGAVSGIGAAAEASIERRDQLARDWEPPDGFDKAQITITAGNAQVGKIDLVNEIMDRPTQSTSELLAIDLTITNDHPARRLELQAIQDRFGSSLVSLEDDAGNRYSSVRFGLGAQPHGADVRSVDPGETATIQLAFDRPVSATKVLTLRLDADAFGGEGTVILSIDNPLYSE